MTRDASTHFDSLDREERDALVSAYALGELEGAERVFVERLLADPAAAEARRIVAETAAVATALRAARAEDPPPRSADLRRAVVAALADAGRPASPTPTQRSPRTGLSGWFALAGALATTALVAVTVLRSQPAAREVARTAATDTQAQRQVFRYAAEEAGTAAAPRAAPAAAGVDREADDHGVAFAAAPAEQVESMPAIVGNGSGYGGRSAGRAAPARSLSRSAGGKADVSAGPGRDGLQSSRGAANGDADFAAGRRVTIDKKIGREQYGRFEENRFLAVADRPLSTFSIDVDTASYAVVRRFLAAGRLPPAEAVRIEEFVNYFSYAYPEPEGDDPFAVALEAADCPWRPGHRLVRIGIAGRDVDRAKRPAGNLVFLIDVSGSMDEPDKLPLVKQALALLVQELTENDRVSIVTYAGDAGLKLPPTSGDQKRKILDVIEGLSAGGSTHGSAGIVLAYEQARERFIPGGANRVILCTDGDLNVGVTSDAALVDLVQEQARGDTFLTVLGFGRGNLQDEKLEAIADKGNGVYAYVDSLREARKVLVEQLTGSTITIAKDVKIQVEFNPAQVASYRLIGYENRRLADADFRDDRKDAGEIGAGHTVTALYEIVPVGNSGDGRDGPGPGAEPLKYQAEKPRVAEPPAAATPASRELLTVKLRFKEPEGDVSVLREFPLADKGGSFADASTDTRFAAAVAAFGMILRGSEFKGDATLPAVAKLAGDALGPDAGGYRAEFLDLFRKAETLGVSQNR
jgi:secreted protein with Ig-like and vWFA domain